VSAEIGGAVVSYGSESTQIDSDGHLGVHALPEWGPLLALLTLSRSSSVAQIFIAIKTLQKLSTTMTISKLLPL
jgi:hypothetical protein